MALNWYLTIFEGAELKSEEKLVSDVLTVWVTVFQILRGLWI